METGGFSFCTEKDVRLAQAEQRKIEYLEERIDYTRPESILHVYDSAIRKQIFQTPVGLLYLKKLQEFLLKSPNIAKEKIQPIPLYDTYIRGAGDGGPSREAQAGQGNGNERMKTGLQVSVILNVMLVVALCAIMLLSLTGDRANIFNYERALQDRYAAWDQELTAREKAVREKERELSIEQPDGLQDE